MRLEGVHHITAITGDAARNVDFYTRVLGLRLVAKTVNQDDPERLPPVLRRRAGAPGAELTFFEYPRAIPGRAGAGMVHRIVSRVASEEALDFWAQRLGAEGVAHERVGDGLRFADPEGLGHELAVRAGADTPLVAEHPEIPAELALQGFDGVRAYTAQPRVQRHPARAAPRRHARWATTRGSCAAKSAAAPSPTTSRRPSPAARAPARSITSRGAPPSPSTRTGTSACATPASPTSGIVDRHYFHSIYFREPSGVLFEIADDGPGFTVDGYSVEELGSTIILPPRLEPQRERIEAILTPLPDPRAQRSPAR